MPAHRLYFTGMHLLWSDRKYDGGLGDRNAPPAPGTPHTSNESSWFVVIICSATDTAVSRRHGRAGTLKDTSRNEKLCASSTASWRNSTTCASSCLPSTTMRTAANSWAWARGLPAGRGILPGCVPGVHALGCGACGAQASSFSSRRNPSYSKRKSSAALFESIESSKVCERTAWVCQRGDSHDGGATATAAAARVTPDACARCRAAHVAMMPRPLPQGNPRSTTTGQGRSLCELHPGALHLVGYQYLWGTSPARSLAPTPSCRWTGA